MFFPLKPFDLSKTERTPNLEKKWVKKGFFKIAQEKYFYPSIVAFTVKSDIEYAIDSKAIDFRLTRFGDFRESWDIKLTDNEISDISDASFYGVVIMDGPIIVLIYKDNEKVSDEEEKNTYYIFLWSSSLQSENKIFLKLPAYYIYGFWIDWMDENRFQNREDIYEIVKVIYRPLYDSNIKIENFNENSSSPRPSRSSTNIISKIPGFYAKMTTCLMKSFMEEFIWIGTDQKQVICFKNDDTNDMKPTVEVQLDKSTADCESILIVQITDERHVIINSENGFILYEILTERKLVIGPFYRQGFEDIISLPYFYTIDSSHWEMIDVGNFKLKIRSSAENYHDEIRVTDFSHMNSLLDSLETRVHDGIAHIRKVEEIINQKQDLLLHCDSLLESLTDIFAFNNRLQQISLIKRNFGVNRSIENLIPLLQSTSVLSNDDTGDQLFSDKNNLQILESRLSINDCDKFSLEISVLNNG
ncbi:5827_t:CDS:2, partial [Diversispora eburnea]